MTTTATRFFTTEVTVQRRATGPATLRAYALDRDAVWVTNRDPKANNRWVVTHATSGLHVGAYFETREETVDLLEALGDQVADHHDVKNRAWLEQVKRVVHELVPHRLSPVTYRVTRPARSESPFVAVIEAAGWDAEDEWGEARCPCGYLIEPDGECSTCGPNPARAAGLI